jgi:Trp operon repressor
MANGNATQNLARGERLQIMLSPDELTAVDDFRFKNRMPSRAAAVRELFRLGLSIAQSTRDTDGRKSADFGVLSELKPGS